MLTQDTSETAKLCDTVRNRQNSKQLGHALVPCISKGHLGYRKPLRQLPDPHEDYLSTTGNNQGAKFLETLERLRRMPPIR